MAVGTTVREDESRMVREDLGETRTSLADKVETLEQGIKGMLRGANAAVVETVESVGSAVGTTAQTVQAAVHGIAQAVQETVRGTIEAMAKAVDVPVHVRRHPWLMIACAITLGYACRRYFFRGLPPE
jgi:ElaB/YqjD/DUF883 family membrane-anchored ribosome-binding protein